MEYLHRCTVAHHQQTVLSFTGTLYLLMQVYQFKMCTTEYEDKNNWVWETDDSQVHRLAVSLNSADKRQISMSTKDWPIKITITKSQIGQMKQMNEFKVFAWQRRLYVRCRLCLMVWACFGGYLLLVRRHAIPCGQSLTGNSFSLQTPAQLVFCLWWGDQQSHWISTLLCCCESMLTVWYV